MLTLDELDVEIAKRVTTSTQRYAHQHQCRVETIRTEDSAIRNGICPSCPETVQRSESKYDKDIIYFTCTAGHIFVRFTCNDPQRTR